MDETILQVELSHHDLVRCRDGLVEVEPVESAPSHPLVDDAMRIASCFGSRSTSRIIATSAATGAVATARADPHARSMVVGEVRLRWDPRPRKRTNILRARTTKHTALSTHRLSTEAEGMILYTY